MLAPEFRQVDDDRSARTIERSQTAGQIGDACTHFVL
jgi:hypothetical protein